MARPLRIQRLGGGHHATARGNERRNIFRDDTDRFHVLELLSDMPVRFGVRLHACVLMDNHFHLLIETPEANLSRSMQWLGVSYSMWFNKRHRRAGHLFQGRFKSCIVEDDHGWQEVARYVHLNPVRLGRLGLNKSQQKASRAGPVSRPDPEVVSERLRTLREFRWSSYRGYAGDGAPLAWVCTEPLSRLCGGRNEVERWAALRQHTEQPVRQGAVECPWERLVAGLVLGTETFARSLKQGLRGRYGDWGRDAALWFGRRQGRLPLARLGELAGGMDYAAVSVAVRRFGQRLAGDRNMRRQVDEIEQMLLNVES